MNVEIFGRPACGFCFAARNVCEKAGIEYTYNELNEDFTVDELFIKVPFSTYPQIFVDGVPVGGYSDFMVILGEATGGII